MTWPCSRFAVVNPGLRNEGSDLELLFHGYVLSPSFAFFQRVISLTLFKGVCYKPPTHDHVGE